MRAIVIPKTGEPSVLVVEERNDPRPGPGEVRVQVAASGVNFADLMARMGLYPDAPPLPAVVGYEVAGTVDDVGPGVPEEMLGERVVAMCRFGGYASVVCLSAAQVAPIPEDMSFEDAASIPVTYLTAWMMLEIMGRVREGDRVLVHSAGGGVGLAALDLLKWRGATAVGVAGTGKHAFLTERGYDEVLGHDEVAGLAAGTFDLILDPIGGPSWAKSLDLLRAGGRLCCFGVSSMSAGSTTRKVTSALATLAQVPWIRMNPVALMNENKGVLGVNMGHLWHEAERVSSWLVSILGLAEAGVVRPHVHAAVPFSECARAHEILHRRENIGKVLLVP